MNIGYAFWGFLGDNKYDRRGNEISTPDGNAFYSWSIIKAFHEAGHKVFSLMKNRDMPGTILKKDNLFDAWCKEERVKAYVGTIDLDVLSCPEKSMELIDVILLEWRWLIEGRNNIELEGTDGWQEDLKARDEILRRAKLFNVPVVVFDLDYKLTEDDIKEYGIKYVIELGNKWKENSIVKSKKVFIPFDFNYINNFEVKDYCKKSLIYVGNRYERDWCIDKYIPEDLDDCIIYGNWKEAGRDSEERWKKLNFGKRLQTSEMYDAYSDSIATILLAKRGYCETEFMTARIIEAVFYGTVPFFIEEYGKNVITEYAGKYAEFLCVHSKYEVEEKVNTLRLESNKNLRKEIIEYLRKHLRFMDCKFFANDVLDLIKGE